MIAIYVALCPNEAEEMHKKGVEVRDRVLSALVPAYSPHKIERTSFGKPILKNSPISFSVSHSHGVVAFAVAGKFDPPKALEGELFFSLSETPESVGVDVELVREVRNISALTRRWFSSGETAYIGEDPERFIARFSQKEALSKCSGKGLAELSRWDTENLGEGEFLWSRLLSLQDQKFALSLAYVSRNKEVSQQ
jgi:phosphopantetheinyl transferase